MKKNKKYLILIIVIFTLVLALVGCKPDTIIINVADSAKTYEVVANKVINACVNIKINLSGKTVGAGSGVIISSNGYIVTNEHVVMNNVVIDKEIVVQVLSSDRKNMYEYSAKVELSNKDLDIAVLKINANNLTYATFANSDEVVFGEGAVMIGYPKGIALSVSKAIVSNPNAAVNYKNIVRNYIMIDANVNAGNSGGAVFNFEGNIIGIVTFRQIDNTVKNEDVVFGIGYAIKSNDVKSVAEKFLK